MCAADLAMAGGLLVLAVPGFRRTGHHVRLREDAAARAPGKSWQVASSRSRQSAP
jgi:hypothetical protein